MTNSEIEYLIIDLYRTPTGSSGGFGHIVFEDDNVETHHIEWCIKEAKAAPTTLKYNFLSESVRLKSINALKALLPLTEEQRLEVINNAYIKI